MGDDAIVEVSELEKTYVMGEVEVPVLRGVTATVRRGAFQAILGPSGCGKTTLLNLIGALDSPTAGRIVVDGTDISTLDDRGRTRYRQKQVGFIFQFFNLMPLLTAVENVELGLEVVEGLSPAEMRKRSEELLAEVGLGEALDKFPSQLSGGQQQRVAIARALAKRPSLVLCDEPTGNLDHKTSGAMVDLMKQLNQSMGMTFVIVTHDQRLAGEASDVISLLDGVVQPGGAQA